MESFRSARAVHFYLHSKIILKKKSIGRTSYIDISRKKKTWPKLSRKKLTTFIKNDCWDINCYASCLPYSILRYEHQITAKQMQILSISKTTTCEMKHYNLQLYREQRRNFHWPSSAVFKISFIKSNRQVLYWERIQVSHTCRRQRREKFSDVVCNFSLKHLEMLV